MSHQMEGVVGISRPRRWLLPGGGPKAHSLQLPSGGIRPPPSEGSKGGEVPQLHRPLIFTSSRGRFLVLHERVSHAMVTELNPVTSSANTSPNPSMRLLIVEDDRESADYLVKAFREVGHVAELA